MTVWWVGELAPGSMKTTIVFPIQDTPTDTIRCD